MSHANIFMTSYWIDCIGLVSRSNQHEYYIMASYSYTGGIWMQYIIGQCIMIRLLYTGPKIIIISCQIMENGLEK